jgi:hypothetical protein
MGITVTYSTGVVIHYKNLPDPLKLQFHGTSSTLTSVPEGYNFIKDPNPPLATVTIEEAEATSLSV